MSRPADVMEQQSVFEGAQQAAVQPLRRPFLPRWERLSAEHSDISTAQSSSAGRRAASQLDLAVAVPAVRLLAVIEVEAAGSLAFGGKVLEHLT